MLLVGLHHHTGAGWDDVAALVGRRADDIAAKRVARLVDGGVAGEGIAHKVEARQLGCAVAQVVHRVGAVAARLQFARER